MTGPERDQLIEDNLKLVWWVMSKYYPSTINSPDRDDFFQIGCIGLLFAADNYEPGPVKFSTFATRNIKCRMRNEFLSRYAQKRTGDEVSLDAPIKGVEEGDLDIVGTIPDERFNPENAFYDLDKFENTLTKEQKKVFRMMCEGLSRNQMTEALNCSKQNIAQKIDRIRFKFAEFYDIPECYEGKLITSKRGRPRKEK